jgi:hypothetical protein
MGTQVSARHEHSRKQRLGTEKNASTHIYQFIRHTNRSQTQHRILGESTGRRWGRGGNGGVGKILTRCVRPVIGGEPPYANTRAVVSGVGGRREPGELSGEVSQ